MAPRTDIPPRHKKNKKLLDDKRNFFLNFSIKAKARKKCQKLLKICRNKFRIFKKLPEILFEFYYSLRTKKSFKNLSIIVKKIVKTS
jgi:hypothetical protein